MVSSLVRVLVVVLVVGLWPGSAIAVRGTADPESRTALSREFVQHRQRRVRVEFHAGLQRF
ncbi:MAG TPA: hypothetical protein DEW10_05235, partial [Bifidobacterium sp.]|nr:hypothetical protein [Bifidobacterium sp.]